MGEESTRDNGKWIMENGIGVQKRPSVNRTLKEQFFLFSIFHSLFSIFRSCQGTNGLWLTSQWGQFGLYPSHAGGLCPGPR